MKPEFLLEVQVNHRDKKKYVLVIDQFYHFDEDIRKTADTLMLAIMDLILNQKLDAMCHVEEIALDSFFYIYVFIICNEEIYNSRISDLVKAHKGFNLEGHADIVDFRFTQINITRIIKNYLLYYFKLMRLSNSGDYILTDYVQTKDDFEYYLSYGLEESSIVLKQSNTFDSIWIFEISLSIEILLIKLKFDKLGLLGQSKKANNKLLKFRHFQFLSEITSKEILIKGKSMIYVVDKTTRYQRKFEQGKNPNEFIINFPIYMKAQSKCFYPYMLFRLLNYLTALTELSNGNLINSLALVNFSIDSTDENFFDCRINLVSEEKNLSIYRIIEDYNSNLEFLKNSSKDKIKDKETTANPDEQSSYGKANLEKKDDDIDILISDVSSNKLKLNHLQLVTYSFLNNLDLVKDLGNCIAFFNSVFSSEDKLVSKFNVALLIFFCFIINHRKKIVEENMDNIISTIYKPENASKRKKSIKPYNKDEIQYQDECEIDYGDQHRKKYVIEKRKKEINKKIKEANRKLREEIRSEVIDKGNYKNKEKSVNFLCPLDKNNIIKQFKD